MADDLALAPFSLILHYSPEMVAELAMGADDPYDIAERYGVEADDYDHLAGQDWFARLVAQKRHEFHDTGMLFVAKAGMMAEALLTRLFQQSMAGVIAAPLTVEVAKQLTDIGRLKPQPQGSTPGSAGAPFQINIQVNGSDVVRTQPALVPAPVTTAAADASAPSGEGAGTGSRVAAPSAPTSTRPEDALAAGAAMTLDFSKPGPKPSYISGLRTPDFDLRPNPRAAQVPTLGAVTTPPSPQTGVGLPPASTSR
jgi:hypothetical protein